VAQRLASNVATHARRARTPGKAEAVELLRARG
jgi:hypothetical protein